MATVTAAHTYIHVIIFSYHDIIPIQNTGYCLSNMNFELFLDGAEI